MVDRNGEDGSPEARRKKLMMMAREIGLTRDDRMDLASYLLRRDVTTWKSLDEVQVLRLLDAIEGFELISQLVTQR